MEARLMLDGDGLPASIVVGRVLSSYTPSSVLDDQLRITYSVYNQEATALSGVLLTTTLGDGVTFADASSLPARNGKELAWSLGTLEAYGRASVEVTVSLNPQVARQVDAGAAAFATLDARASTDTAPAAMLRDQAVDPGLLAATPDANSDDPFVQEQAARLDYDPGRIFEFLRDEVGYQSYSGSLRGARGTLWDLAGNTLDEASLGVALLRASGIPARYSQGTISDALAQELILSMFPEPYQVLGNIPPGTEVGDPAHDPTLLAESRHHYWFQYDTGGGFVDADTTFADTQIGRTLTASTGTFAEVPDALRHKARITLDAETYSQAGALFGADDGLSTTTVLDHTFNTVDLVGRPITVGNLVASSSTGFIFFAQTNTYTPYLVVGDDALEDSELPEAIVGRPYQEVLTNFPLGSQILTGLFLDITLSGPGMPPESYNRALVDRIGYAARQGLASPGGLSVDPSAPPVITPFDVTTLSILSSAQDPRAAEVQRQRAIARVNAVSSDSDPTLVGQTEALIAVTRAQLAHFAAVSDPQSENLAAAFSVAAYFDRPRILAVSTRAIREDGQDSTTFEFDLIDDSIRAVVAPGQNTQARIGFAVARGLFDSVLEASTLPTPPDGANNSAIMLIVRSLEQGIELVTIDATNFMMIQSLQLPAEAIARITASVQAGLTIVAPKHALTVDGEQTTAWLQVDPATGETIAVAQNGRHQGIATYAAVYVAIYAGATNVAIYYAFHPFDANWQDAAKSFATGAGATLLGSGFLVGFVAYFLGLAADYYRGLAHIDPPLMPLTLSLDVPHPTTPGASAIGEVATQADVTAGTVAANLRTSHATASGDLTASWASTATASFLASSLGAASATVFDANGNTVGTGAAELLASLATAVSISGVAQYSIRGRGRLSFYGPAHDALGIGGDWDAYAATVSGNVSITFTTSALRLNGQTLPAGTYTITTSSATLGGRGATSAANFSGSVAIDAAAGTVQLNSSPQRGK